MPHRRRFFGSIGLSLSTLLAASFGALALGCGILLAYQLSNIAETARSLRLQKQAAEIRHSLQLAANGAPIVGLPPERIARYQGEDPQFFYALRDGAGTFVADSSPALSARFGAQFLRGLMTGENERAVGPQEGERFHFLSEAVEAPGREGLTLIVGQRTGAIDALLDEVEWRMLADTGLLAVPALLLVFVASLAIIRSRLAPLRRLSQQIGRIAPDDPGRWLEQANLPRELEDLARTTHAAARRLDEVIADQRRFTADTAHQLLTPLALLSARVDDANGAVAAQDLRGDIRRMENLVRQLLQFSRLASLSQPHGPIDLRDIARQAAIDLAPLAIAEGKNLAYAEPGTPCMIDGNANAVREALDNLIRNGVRHTAPGTNVEVAVCEPASIDVADRGEGLPEAGRERLLEPFYTTQIDKGGTGLGLAIASEVMRRHGGVVEMRDRPEGGALFRLRFGVATGKA